MHWLEQMADALDYPLFLLDDSLRLRHANRAARSILSAGAPLRQLTDGRVGPADGLFQRDFGAALQAATSGERRLWHRETRAGLLSVWLLPLRQVVTWLALAMPAPAVADVAGFAETNGLSRAETRVLARLARGESTLVAARALGLAVSTVRSHRLALLHKCGQPNMGALLQDLFTLPALGPADPAQGE
jgi:DNA-binding CsgD family transcriptional regulator